MTAADPPVDDAPLLAAVIANVDHLAATLGALSLDADEEDQAVPPLAPASGSRGEEHSELQPLDSVSQLRTPPVASPYWASEHELLSLAAEIAAASAALDTEDGRWRLARTLADPRILATPFFTCFVGRQRLHALFATLRASTPDATGTRLVWAVVQALGEALLLPPPAAVEGPYPFREADVARIVDLATALVETCTTWTTRADPHHFVLQGSLAKRIALCVAELALPFADRPGPLHARAILLRANVLRVFDQTGPAVEFFYEAWAELRKKGLVPSDEEAILVPRLAILLFETFQVRTATYVSGSAYLPPSATGDERIVAEYNLAYLSMTGLRWRKEFAAGERHGRRCLEIADLLEPLSARVLRARALVDLISIANHRLQPRAVLSYGNQALNLAASMHDLTLSDLDFLGYLRYVKLYAPLQIALSVCKLAVSMMKRSKLARETPILAHALFQLGDVYLAASGGRLAAGCFAASLAALEPFARLYPPEHPRRLRIEWALAELRAGRLPPPAFPPPQQGPGPVPEPPPTTPASSFAGTESSPALSQSPAALSPPSEGGSPPTKLPRRVFSGRRRRSSASEEDHGRPARPPPVPIAPQPPPPVHTPSPPQPPGPGDRPAPPRPVPIAPRPPPPPAFEPTAACFVPTWAYPLPLGYSGPPPAGAPLAVVVPVAPGAGLSPPMVPVPPRSPRVVDFGFDRTRPKERPASPHAAAGLSLPLSEVADLADELGLESPPEGGGGEDEEGRPPPLTSSRPVRLKTDR